jgi:hypothetical protein
MIVLSVGAKLFQAYGQTDEKTYVTKVIAALGNFADSTKNLTHPFPTLHRKPCVNYKTS